MKNLHINLIIVTLMLAIGYSHPPIVFDDEYTLDEDTQIFIDIYATHSYGYNVFINIINEPEFGTLEITGGGEGNNTSMLEVLYIPNIDYYGNDSFTYNAIHNEYVSEEATITLIINPVNDSSTVTDIDGNVYETVQIGDQLWMAENLKVTHYNNGDPVTYITSEEHWGSMDEGQYAVYDDEPTNANIYGNIYNWAVIGDIRGICPVGWHVPSDDEYTVLTDFLGGESVAGGKMKEAGLEHWNYYSDQISLEATNESGFTGLPAGHRNTNSGDYIYMGFYGYFWSSTENGSDLAWRRYLFHYSSGVARDTFGKPNGFSIRCLRD